MSFGQEHDLFRGTVRRFVEEEIVPNVDEWEERGQIPRDLFRRMGELGFLGVDFPADHGGGGADFWMSVVLAEELARCRSGGVAFSVIVHTDMSSPWLARLGTEEQKARYLPGVIRGETVCALAITEPGAGSDMAALETVARRRKFRLMGFYASRRVHVSIFGRKFVFYTGRQRSGSSH